MELSSLDVGLYTDALEDVWDYAVGSPGKRTRSRVLLAAEAATRDALRGADPRLTVAATAVEILHLASLAHDDVLDTGDIRRGLASLPASFGAPLATAAGGVFFAHALNLFACCGDGALAVAAQTGLRMCEGQMCELRALHDLGRTPAEYFAAVRGKTAGMFWLAARLGGMLGGANPRAEKTLACYGEALGIAYQIIDDILDVVAGPEHTGKPLGNDLDNGNYTLPVIYALEENPELVEHLQADAATETVIGHLLDTRAIARASAEARRWIDRARGAARTLPEAGGLLEIADGELAALGSAQV